jgi:hypothetical protein
MQKLIFSGVNSSPMLARLVMLHTENTSSPIICVAAMHELPVVDEGCSTFVMLVPFHSLCYLAIDMQQIPLTKRLIWPYKYAFNAIFGWSGGRVLYSYLCPGAMTTGCTSVRFEQGPYIPTVISTTFRSSSASSKDISLSFVASENQGMDWLAELRERTHTTEWP